MSKYIEELMSPQLMFAMYGFIAFVVALYLLSVVYVFIDAKRRGVQAFWAWACSPSSRSSALWPIS